MNKTNSTPPLLSGLPTPVEKSPTGSGNDRPGWAAFEESVQLRISSSGATGNTPEDQPLTKRTTSEASDEPDRLLVQIPLSSLSGTVSLKPAEELIQEINQLKKEQDSIRDQVKTLQGHLDESESRLQKALEEKSSLESQHETLKEVSCSISNEATAVAQNSIDLQLTVALLKMSNAELQEKISSLETDLLKTKEELLKQNKELDEKSYSLENMQRTLENLTTTLSESKALLKSRESELTELHKAITDKNMELEQLKAENAVLLQYKRTSEERALINIASQVETPEPLNRATKTSGMSPQEEMELFHMQSPFDPIDTKERPVSTGATPQEAQPKTVLEMQPSSLTDVVVNSLEKGFTLEEIAMGYNVKMPEGAAEYTKENFELNEDQQAEEQALKELEGKYMPANPEMRTDFQKKGIDKIWKCAGGFETCLFNDKKLRGYLIRRQHQKLISEMSTLYNQSDISVKSPRGKEFFDAYGTDPYSWLHSIAKALKDNPEDKVAQLAALWADFSIHMSLANTTKPEQKAFALRPGNAFNWRDLAKMEPGQVSSFSQPAAKKKKHK